MMTYNLDNSYKEKVKDYSILNNLRVLVVDDNADHCMLITFILESYGVQQVIIVESAFEAFKQMKEFQPNLLIVDIVMPEMDGYSFICQIRTLDTPQKDIPAIAVTAGTFMNEITTEESYNKALSSGFQACLQKPLYYEELISEIKKVCFE